MRRPSKRLPSPLQQPVLHVQQRAELHASRTRVVIILLLLYKEEKIPARLQPHRRPALLLLPHHPLPLRHTVVSSVESAAVARLAECFFD